MTVILTSVVTLLFITYIAPNIFYSSRFLTERDYTAFVAMRHNENAKKVLSKD